MFVGSELCSKYRVLNARSPVLSLLLPIYHLALAASSAIGGLAVHLMYDSISKSRLTEGRYGEEEAAIYPSQSA
jgi:hypothetical protein